VSVYDPQAYQGKEDLKANDRLQMKKRPMFMKWYEGICRSIRRMRRGGRRVWIGKVIEEAKAVFGVEGEYEEKCAKALRAMGAERL
jgi:hypothetical protein